MRPVLNRYILSSAVVLAVSAVDAMAQRRGASTAPQVACSTGRVAGGKQADAANNALLRALVTRGAQRDAQYTAAITAARAAIAEDATNAYPHALLGQALAASGDLAGAGAAFDAAARICPEYAAQVTPLREEAWAQTFTAGLEAFQAGDTAKAVQAWESASQFDPKRGDAFFNLGVVYGARRDWDRSVKNYVAALEAPPSTGTDSAQVAARADMRATTLLGLSAAGAGLFQAQQYQRAADIFDRVHTLDPNARDAWYNHALSLYKLERWEPLVPVGTRIVEIDPLNYNARIILFNAYKGLSEAAKTAKQTAVETRNRELALKTLSEADALPVHIEGISLDPVEGATKLTGTVKGAKAAAGSKVRVEFTLFGAGGQVGTHTVEVTAPAKDQTAPFEATIPTTTGATGYRYRVL